jgi:2-polyprenyl-3-methyl-5-hydroxy-6-metoxy-1,4-benzoquinol methylase
MSSCLYCPGNLRPFAQFSSQLVVDIQLTPQLKQRLPELRYGKCDRCGSLIAEDARLAKDFDLLGLYETLPEAYWAGLETGETEGTAQPLRNHFFAFLEQQLNPKQLPLHICDVGCGDGSILRGLGSHWNKTGIEPGKQAGAIAAQATNGIDRDPSIHWIQGTLTTAQLPQQSMDVLLYIDVTEHLADPIAELATARQYLKPGGRLVIYTGNAASRFAKLAGVNWAYLRCAGHVAVASQLALVEGLSQAGFEAIQTWPQQHPSSPGLGKWLFEYVGSRLRRHWAVPLYWDHMLIIAQRPL